MPPRRTLCTSPTIGCSVALPSVEAVAEPVGERVVDVVGQGAAESGRRCRARRSGRRPARGGDPDSWLRAFGDLAQRRGDAVAVQRGVDGMPRRSTGEPRCGEPRQISMRVTCSQNSCAAAACSQALRAIRPPMLSTDQQQFLDRLRPCREQR